AAAAVPFQVRHSLRRARAAAAGRGGDRALRAVHPQRRLGGAPGRRGGSGRRQAQADGQRARRGHPGAGRGGGGTGEGAMKIRRELWFGLTLMAIVLVGAATVLLRAETITNGHLGLLILPLVVVAIMLGFPTHITLMGMG